MSEIWSKPERCIFPLEYGVGFDDFNGHRSVVHPVGVFGVALPVGMHIYVVTDK